MTLSATTKNRGGQMNQEKVTGKDREKQLDDKMKEIFGKLQIK